MYRANFLWPKIGPIHPDTFRYVPIRPDTSMFCQKMQTHQTTENRSVHPEKSFGQFCPHISKLFFPNLLMVRVALHGGKETLPMFRFLIFKAH